MNASKRFRLLKLRSQGVAEFKHHRDVPIYDKFIPDDIFDEYDEKNDYPVTAQDDKDRRKILVKKYVPYR